MNEKKVLLISLVVVLALSTIIAPIYAYDYEYDAANPTEYDVEYLSSHTVTFFGYENNGDGTSTWWWRICSLQDPSISHSTFFWCNPNLVVATSESDPFDPDEYYVVEDPTTGARGIKFDEGIENPGCKNVWIKVNTVPEVGTIDVTLKAGSENVYRGEILGPLTPNNCEEIPEFATIVMPVASIIGLLFFFNHRKLRND